MTYKNTRKKLKSKRLKKKYRLITLYLIFMTTVFILSSIIPLRLAIARYQEPEPQAILVLGGNKKRFEFAAQFSHLHPDLDILVSAGYSRFEQNRAIFQQAGVADQKVDYDFCPTDTVTNFTCSIDYFKKNNVQHIYLITSDYHMTRSRAIGTLVLGSRGIAITPVSVPSKGFKQESKIRVIRDCLRSLIWIVTGRSGASLNPDLRS